MKKLVTVYEYRCDKCGKVCSNTSVKEVDKTTNSLLRTNYEHVCETCYNEISMKVHNEQLRLLECRNGYHEFIYIVQYNADTIEGRGPMVISAVTTDFDAALKIGEKLPKVMGIYPSAEILKYKNLKYDMCSIYSVNENDQHVCTYTLHSNGSWSCKYENQNWIC